MKMQISMSDTVLRDGSSAKKRTSAEIKALPTFSASVAESVYKLSDTLYVDNINGLGATPNNSNVMYMGFVATIKLSMFTKLVLSSEHRGQDAKNITELIKAGYGMGCPCLYIDIDQFIESPDGLTGHAEVAGHEGRARVLAMAALGFTEAPIQFFIRGYRARHVKSDAERFREWLNLGIISEDGKIAHQHVFQHKLVFG